MKSSTIRTNLFILAFTTIAATTFLSCKTSDLSTTKAVETEGHFYWADDSGQILYRGRCLPGKEANVSNCQEKLQWIDIKDLSDRSGALQQVIQTGENLIEEGKLMVKFETDPRLKEEGLFKQREGKRIVTENKAEREKLRKIIEVFVQPAGITMHDQDLPTEILRRFLEESHSRISVSAGANHSCALFAGGEAKCWGANGYGQLGQNHDRNLGGRDGDMENLRPIRLGSKVLQVSAGDYHTCALLAGGELKCWGKNDEGQLGQGHTNSVGQNDGDMESLQPIQLGGKVLY